jgi:hypothetical protein
VFVVVMVFSSGFRDLSSSRELRGILGATDRALHGPMIVVAASMAIAVTAATAPLVGWPPPALLLVAGGACLAAYRLRARPRTAYDGLVLETGVG